MDVIGVALGLITVVIIMKHQGLWLVTYSSMVWYCTEWYGIESGGIR